MEEKKWEGEGLNFERMKEGMKKVDKYAYVSRQKTCELSRTRKVREMIKNNTKSHKVVSWIAIGATSPSIT